MIGKWCAVNNMLKKRLEKPVSMAKREEAVNAPVKEAQPKDNDKHWALEEMSRLKARWKKQDEKLDAILKKIDPMLKRFIKLIVKMIIIGIICNIIASSFWPEFPEKHPAIFGWFDGWLQFGEFLYKSFFKGIYAIFTGNFKGFRVEFATEVKELFQQFVNWLSMLKF